MNPKPELIGVQNGVLNTLTKELIKFEEAKENYVTVKIPWQYNKEIPCLKIHKFLTEILTEPQRLLAQELMATAYTEHTHTAKLT